MMRMSAWVRNPDPRRLDPRLVGLLLLGNDTDVIELASLESTHGSSFSAPSCTQSKHGE
jgi:hypothetical protein